MPNKKQKRPRTYARNRATAVSRRGYEKLAGSDGEYLLKLVICIILGTLWLKFDTPMSWFGIPLNGIPIGMLLGFILVSQFEKYQFNRKIWYPVLIIVTVVSYFAPSGIVI